MKRGDEMPSGPSREPWTLTLDDFHSADPAMQKCLDLARLAARTDLPILIVGESGTGKTLLARAIHNSSKRIAGPFVAFNAAALSDTLLDSQLFGHERGAFTGAERTVRGKFELANGGTLFLDEIADMSPTAQAKILRAIEYGAKGSTMAGVGVGVAMALLFAGGAVGKLVCGVMAERVGIIRAVIVTEAATTLGILAVLASPCMSRTRSSCRSESR